MCRFPKSSRGTESVAEIAGAPAIIKAREKKRYALEPAEHEAKMAALVAIRARSHRPGANRV
jgi:hypothetical protein